MNSLVEHSKYNAAHRTVKYLWGKASQFLCIKCGKQAQDWAYDGKDPTELFAYDPGAEHREGVQPMRFSIWPEFYAPMCRSCHKKMDLGFLKVKNWRNGDSSRRRMLPTPRTEAEWDAHLRRVKADRRKSVAKYIADLPF